jgi:hypothetical protein
LLATFVARPAPTGRIIHGAGQLALNAHGQHLSQIRYGFVSNPA